MPAPSLPPAVFLMARPLGQDRAGGHLLERFPLEIISVDSALVYRGMTIGTASPTRPRSPARRITCSTSATHRSLFRAAFCDDARRLMADIVARGRVPLLVGGTMRISARCLQGLDDLPRADAALRKQLEAEAADRAGPRCTPNWAGRSGDRRGWRRTTPSGSAARWKFSGYRKADVGVLDRAQSELPYRVLQLP